MPRAHTHMIYPVDPATQTSATDCPLSFVAFGIRRRGSKPNSPWPPVPNADLSSHVGHAGLRGIGRVWHSISSQQWDGPAFPRHLPYIYVQILST